MKTSSVIVSVLLATVALEVSAFHVNNNENLLENGKRWLRFRQGESSDDESRALDERRDDRQRDPIDDSDFGFGEESTERHRYRSQNLIAIDRSSGLTERMVKKMAALQNIALDRNIAGRANDLNGALSVQKNSVKLSDREFVSFSDAVIKRLDDGVLEFMCIKPQKDAVWVEYRFDKLETVGSFKSNARDSRSGRCTVVMKNVFSNVSTGFDLTPRAALGPSTTFQYADADVRTDDGAETLAFNDALERRYLNVLENAVSAEVLESTDRGMIARMKNEIRKPMVFRPAEQKTKLFDMRWKEDDLAMEMSNVGLRNPEQAVQQMLKSVSFQRKSDNAYRMRYDFALKDLEWSSALTVEWTDKRASAPLANFKIEKVDIRVIVNKSRDQQKSCDCGGSIDANVTVRGLQYELNENVRPELMTKIENELRRFIERSWESCVRESLKQELCNARKY